jgi:hypothetical protein
MTIVSGVQSYSPLTTYFPTHFPLLAYSITSPFDIGMDLLRIENVPQPHKLITLLNTPIDIELVYTNIFYQDVPVNFILLPEVLPDIAKSLTVDVSTFHVNRDGRSFTEFQALPVLENLYSLTGQTALIAYPITLHFRSVEEREVGMNLGPPNSVTLELCPKVASSEGLQSPDDLGYLTRQYYWTNRNDQRRFMRYYRHKFMCLSGHRNLEAGMEVPFSHPVSDWVKNHYRWGPSW